MAIKSVAIASHPEAQAAATELLKKGTAMDAVVGGVLAAAAASPSVLLGPLHVLVAGGGAGARGFDGRVRQPGKGAPRPRGFQRDEPIPDAARVGAPSLPGALFAAQGAFGKLTLLQVAAAALDASKKTPRGDVLRAIVERGPLALAERGIGGELVAVVGRLEGGLLTLDDLADPEVRAAPCDRARAGAADVAWLPWAPASMGARHAHVVLAADWHGTIACAAFEAPPDGVRIDALGLVAPLGAEPVRRGETRVSPGTALDSAAPLAVREESSKATLALGWIGATFTRDALAAWASDTTWVVGEDVPAGLEGRLMAVVPGDPARALAKGGARASETT